MTPYSPPSANNTLIYFDKFLHLKKIEFFIIIGRMRRLFCFVSLKRFPAAMSSVIGCLITKLIMMYEIFSF
jgi:hypothetical protein